MSAFKLEYKDLEFTILLDPDPEHVPVERWTILTDEDKELLKEGEIAFYSMSITSNKGEDSVDHFIPGVQLPTNKDEQMIDLELILLEDGLLDEILEHWELRLSTSLLPKWAISS